MGENRDGNRDGKGEDRMAGVGQGQERRKVNRAQAGRAAGAGVKKEFVGRGCVRVLVSLQEGRCQLGSAPIISVTVSMGDWSQR